MRISDWSSDVCSSDLHPRHALYQGCAAGVDALDRQLVRAPDERSACMKASLVELAVRNGFDRVDHVLLSIRSGEVQAGQNVFVVQGALGDPAHRRAHMRPEIGSASSRERVGRYGEIRGVAG